MFCGFPYFDLDASCVTHTGCFWFHLILKWSEYLIWISIITILYTDGLNFNMSRCQEYQSLQSLRCYYGIWLEFLLELNSVVGSRLICQARVERIMNKTTERCPQKLRRQGRGLVTHCHMLKLRKWMPQASLRGCDSPSVLLRFLIYQLSALSN